MTISEVGQVLLAAGIGMGLGWFFFGGLWWTLQRLPMSQHPMQLALGSLLLRTVLTMIGFYFVTTGFAPQDDAANAWVPSGDWRRLLSAVAGFLLVRQLLIHRIRPRNGEDRVRERRAVGSPAPNHVDGEWRGG